MRKIPQSITCKRDGKVFPTYSSYRRHFWQAHRERMRPALEALQNARTGHPPVERKSPHLNVRANRNAPLQLILETVPDAIRILKAKRNRISETIEVLEKLPGAAKSS